MAASLSSNLLAGSISFLLTLMILSYLIGDNPAFRLAVYLFVGVAAGYAAAIAWRQVLIPRLIDPLLAGNVTERLLAFVALVLGILLLGKLSARTSRLGNPSIAFLVGVGAAVAIGGAVTGTLFPQTQASVNAFDLATAGQFPLEHLFFGTVALGATVTTLAYFHFGAKSTPGGPQRNKFVVVLSWVGQIFIAITLGVLFAGVFTAAMTALIERLNFVWTFLAGFF
jgi:hypothetical protein